MNRSLLLQIVFTIDNIQKENLVKDFSYKDNILKVICENGSKYLIYLERDIQQAKSEKDYRSLKDE